MKYLVILAIVTAVPALGWCFRPRAEDSGAVASRQEQALVKTAAMKPDPERIGLEGVTDRRAGGAAPQAVVATELLNLPVRASKERDPEPPVTAKAAPPVPAIKKAAEHRRESVAPRKQAGVMVGPDGVIYQRSREGR